MTVEQPFDLATASERPLISNLQVLRAFAAINVVILHCVTASIKYSGSGGLLGFLDVWGASGVDLFFVISGFVMVYIQGRSPRSPGAFLLNRVTRVAPLYWVLTTALLAITLLLPGQMTQDQDISPTYLLASYLFATTPTGLAMPVLYLGWTLEYEMVFYILFALSIVCGRPLMQFLFVAAGLAVFTSTGLYSWLSVEFLAGMALGYFYLAGRCITRPVTLLLIGAVLLAASIAIPFDPIYRPLVWGLPAFLIVIGAVYARQTSSRVLVLLGDASYSIYLIQVFSIPVFYRLAFASPIPMPVEIRIAGVALLSIFAGVATYLLVERVISARVKSVVRRMSTESVATLDDSPLGRAPKAVEDGR